VGRFDLPTTARGPETIFMMRMQKGVEYVGKSLIALAALSGLMWGAFLVRKTLFADIPYPDEAAALASGVVLFAAGFVLLRFVRKEERIKKEFVSVASHRLRTPLTRLRWMVDNGLELAQTREEKELAADMKETVEDLTGVVNRLLEASEAEKTSDFYSYFFEEGNFAIVVRQVVADYARGARRKNISLSVSIPENIPRAVFDYDRIKVAASAILENAIIYTPSGGSVEVSVEADKKHITYKVKDSGIGIPEDVRRFVFTKFFRSKEAVSIDRDRVGLGLFVAKEIVRRHGGKIGFESKWHERGSTFWFTIPVA